MKKCRITVVKMARYDDLIEKYENPIEHACDMKLGQGRDNTKQLLCEIHPLSFRSFINIVILLLGMIMSRQSVLRYSTRHSVPGHMK